MGNAQTRTRHSDTDTASIHVHPKPSAKKRSAPHPSVRKSKVKGSSTTRKKKARSPVALSPIPPRRKSTTRKSAQQKPLTFEQLLKKRAPSSLYVLYHTYNLLDVDQSGVISLSNLEVFLSRYTNEKWSYHEVREMVHRVTNSYEITFEDFRRIMEMDEGDFKTKVKSVDCIGSMLHVPQDPNSMMISSSTDSLYSDCSTPAVSSYAESLDSLPVTPSHDSLDMRAEVEERKNQYGIFKHKQPQSEAKIYKGSEKNLSMWTNKNQVAPFIKRIKSTSKPFHNKMERDYFSMEQAFRAMDTDRKGHLVARDILTAMRRVGTSNSNSLSEVSTLMKLVGKKSLSDTISMDDFLQLYAKCCKTKKKKMGTSTKGTALPGRPRKVHPAKTATYKNDMRTTESPKGRMKDAR